MIPVALEDNPARGNFPEDGDVVRYGERLLGSVKDFVQVYVADADAPFFP